MFIEFTFNPKLLFIIIYPIFKEIERFISKQFIVKGKDHNLFKIFRLFLCNEFAFIFLLIFKCMNKSHKKEITIEEHEKNDENEKNDEYDKNDENSAIIIVEGEMQTVRVQNQIKSIIYLFLLSGLYFGAYIFNYLVRQNILRRCRNSIGIIYEIVILYVLSLLILKEKYHKHHYLSISIIVLTLTALFIIYINKLDDSGYSIYKRILVLFSLLCFIWLI